MVDFNVFKCEVGYYFPNNPVDADHTTKVFYTLRCRKESEI